MADGSERFLQQSNSDHTDHHEDYVGKSAATKRESETPLLSFNSHENNFGKSNTCWEWATGQCEETEEACKWAHHTFSHIVENATATPYKRTTCKHWQGTCDCHDKGCWWPEEMCGFAHEPSEPDQVTLEEMKERRASIKELAKQRPYNVKMLFTCKKCEDEHKTQKSIEEHCKTCKMRSGSGDSFKVHAAQKPGQSRIPERLKMEKMEQEIWR